MKSKQPFGDVAGMNPIDIPERIIKKPVGVLKAFCTSLTCSPRGTGSGKEKKNAKKTDIDCPDCGHALFWGKEEP